MTVISIERLREQRLVLEPVGEREQRNASCAGSHSSRARRQALSSSAVASTTSHSHEPGQRPVDRQAVVIAGEERNVRGSDTSAPSTANVDRLSRLAQGYSRGTPIVAPRSR